MTEAAAALVRKLRTDRGQSLRAAARELGVDPSYLSRVESGSRSVSDELKERVSTYYGLERELVDLAAGRLPQDVLSILQSHPELLAELRQRYGDG